MTVNPSIEPIPTSKPLTGKRVGVVDEYGTVWDGEPGASTVIGDIVPRADQESFDLYLRKEP